MCVCVCESFVFVAAPYLKKKGGTCARVKTCGFDFSRQVIFCILLVLVMVVTGEPAGGRAEGRWAEWEWSAEAARFSCRHGKAGCERMELYFAPLVVFVL